MATTHVAAGDCERCRPGPLAQPVNAVSSLAFVVAGAAIVRGARRRGARRSEVAVGWAAVAAGLGSVAYHGPGGVLGRYVHDASLLALLGATALSDAEAVAGRAVPRSAVAAVPAVAAVGAHPMVTDAAQSAVLAVAAAAEAARMATARSRGLRRARVVQVPVAIAGVLAHGLGRSGGPLCRPDSLAQPHALWHVAAATNVWLRSLDLR